MEPEILQLIGFADEGVAGSSEQLFAALYGELHRLAEQQLARGGGDLSLGTTTLLHETYLNVAGRDGTHFPDRARFMGYAARAMRALVVDHARRSRAQKRGGGVQEVTLTGDAASNTAATGADAPDMDRLADAVDELAAVEPALAQLVDLHFFCGFSFTEIAEMRGVSERTVQRDWRKARLFLFQAMREAAP